MEDDWQWVERAQRGDAAALAELVRRYRRLVRALAVRFVGGLDADDAEQEIWLAVRQKLWQLERGDRFAAWLRTLCYYRAVNFRKARAGRRRRELSLDGDAWLRLTERVADPHYRLEEILEQRTARGLIADVMAELPADYGLVLKLHYLDGMSYAAIARSTGLPLSTIKWRLYTARRLLRDRLTGRMGRRS